MAKAALQEPVNDADIQRSATGMINIHAKNAAVLCEQQIEKMRRRNCQEGERIWQRIQVAIAAQQRSASNHRDATFEELRPLA